MTKYILNSGGSRNNPTKAKESIEETLKDLGQNPKVLFCFFAQKREDWETKYKEKMEGFKKMVPSGTEVSFDLAFPDTFAEQIKNSDAVVIFGGDDFLLQCWFKQFDIPKIWKDKVVVTSSASSNALAKHFWTCDWRQSMDGLGILPIKFISHYKSDFGVDDPRGPIDWDEAQQELENYGDKDLSMYTLEEGEFVIIEK
ncbi:type 1 glutamine amidotransferase-like domain-containing protein [Candidatus Parcubacteria bacterium]|jgi:peptidase E|nr:type 1 glutamine amidotransferase-like domain-containing protein [Candidatus Parcubacteria bacterium]MBT7228828.1 type 1 glutamine amidotransferase-like domain-containing protein [Candidatus Parcubacteria bacterium]